MFFTLPFLVVIGLALPFLAWSSARRLSSPDSRSTAMPSARVIAVQVLVVQALVFLLAWLAMVGAQLSVSWRSTFTPVTVLIATTVVAGGLVVAWLEGRRPLGPRDVLRTQLRRVAATEPVWLGATIVAALAEEFAYRGVLSALLTGTLGAQSAVVVSACLFGLAHLGQGWRGALASAGFALALQAVVSVSRGLLLAILAHLAYDLGAAWLGRRPSRQNAKDAAAQPALAEDATSRRR